MKFLLNNLQYLTGHRTARLMVRLFAGLLLASSVSSGLRGVSADGLSKGVLPDCVTSVAVNDNGDGADATPGDGVCETAAGNGVCTLRAAVQEANALAACAPFTITITATGAINLTAALPVVTHPNLTINGPGANLLTINGGVGFRIFDIDGAITLNLYGLTLANSDITGVAGPNDQGGIIRSRGATLTLTDCAVLNGRAGQASAIQVSPGNLTLNGCTIAGNGTNTSGGVVVVFAPATVNISNSTFSGNSTHGGGALSLHKTNNGTSYAIVNATITNSTFTGNTSLQGAGGIEHNNFNDPNNTPPVLKNTLVAGNTGPTPDINAFVSAGNNLIGKNTGTTITNQMASDLVGTGANPINPLLAALAHYGGPTQTHALLPCSPAINAGTASGALTTDQRGFSRAGNVDIGAFESQGFTLTVSGGDNQTTLINTAFSNPLSVTVTSTNSEPVNGGRVLFTPPASGARCTVAGNPATITSGAATSGTVTANATVGGPYNVTASASGAASSVNFALTNVRNEPTFTPAAAITRQKGSPAGAAVIIGTVSDAQTPAESLTVTRVTGGTATGITVSDITNTNGTITALLNANCSATTGTVRFQVSDGSFTSTGDLQVNVTANTAPTLTYGDVFLSVRAATTNSPTAATDNGSITNYAVLSVGLYTGTSSVDSAGVVSFSNAAPVGTHTIRIRATDNCNATTDAQFTLTISNGAPTSSDIANQTINKNSNTGALGFTIDDAETPAASLTLSKASSNTTLVPTANISFGGSGANRTVTVTPANNQIGTATITITVNDGNGGTASDTFVLTVNDPPSITAIAATRQQGNQPTNVQIATVLDTEDAENTLLATVGGGASANSNGVTINNLTVNAAGQVRADLAVTCTATNASFTLAVTDSLGAMASTTLIVTVPANTAPAVGNYPNSTVLTGGMLTITPHVPPTDNNTVASVTATATPNSFTGSFSGNTSSGGVMVTNANPAGSYTITVTLTDNCGATTTRSFMLTVSACGAVLSKQRELFAANGGTDSFTVTIDAACSWTATSDNPDWITINAPAAGFAGPGTVNYSVATNTTTTRRTGSITVAGQTFRVWQSARFNDVPLNHSFYDFIGKLSALGITLGCGNGNYCPDDNTTREQMAIFIERGLGVFNPPLPNQQTFQDVPSTSYSHPFVEDLVARGITAGCAAGPPRMYCPAAAVTREQMAIFILRGLGVFTPPAGPQTPTFADVLNSGATDYSYEFIEEFVRRGITSGCAAGPPRLYCPTAMVTRGQMAVFLVRAFGS
jgi:hypothetical protein